MYLSKIAFCQNLVPNNSFEQAIKNPCVYIFDRKESINNYFINWYTPTGGTSDPWYYSDTIQQNCTQNLKKLPLLAHSGERCIGIYMSGNKYRAPNAKPTYREYVQTKLNNPLQPGKIYFVSLYCRRLPYSGTNTNNLGFYFSTDSLTRPTDFIAQLPVKPQVNMSQLIIADTGWVQISGCFLAQEAYKYLTIGNFYDDTQTLFEIAALPNRDELPYYLIDDIDVHKTPIHQLPQPQFLGSDTTLCPRQTLTLHQPKLDDVSYYWPDNNQSDSYTITQTGNYIVSAKAGECVLKDTINVKVESAVNLPADTTLCWGEKFILKPDQFNSGYIWNDGSHDSTLIVSQSGTYSIMVPSTTCRLTDSTRVNFIDCTVSVPNVFTPNGDGKNDCFVISYNKEVNSIWKLAVFNRWGRVIYETDSYENNWSAEGVPSGLYYYYLSDSIRNQQLKGWVEILR